MIHAQGFEIIPQFSRRSGRIFVGVMAVLLILVIATLEYIFDPLVKVNQNNNHYDWGQVE